MNEESLAHGGLSRQNKQYYTLKSAPDNDLRPSSTFLLGASVFLSVLTPHAIHMCFDVTDKVVGS